MWLGWCKQQMTNYPYIHKQIKSVQFTTPEKCSVRLAVMLQYDSGFKFHLLTSFTIEIKMRCGA